MTFHNKTGNTKNNSIFLVVLLTVFFHVILNVTKVLLELSDISIMQLFFFLLFAFCFSQKFSSISFRILLELSNISIMLFSPPTAIEEVEFGLKIHRYRVHSTLNWPLHDARVKTAFAIKGTKKKKQANGKELRDWPLKWSVMREPIKNWPIRASYSIASFAAGSGAGSILRPAPKWIQPKARSIKAHSPTGRTLDRLHLMKYWCWLLGPTRS